MPQEEQMQEQAAQDRLVDVLITPAADMTITPETFQALANDLFDEDVLTLPGAVVIGPLGRVDSLRYLTDVVWLRERHAPARVAYIGNQPEPLLDTMQALADGTHDVYLWCSGWNRPRPAPAKGRRQGGVSGRSGTEVALVALARPHSVHVWDRELSQPGPHELLVQHYLLISGKWPPFTFEDALVEATVQKHFGLVKHYAVYS
jgi:hypothetical protein